MSYRDSYLNENAPTDVLNPSSAPSLTFTFQQNLLRGFGVAVNARTIRVSQLNVKASALNFKTQVSNTVNQVLNLYYAIVRRIRRYQSEIQRGGSGAEVL